MAQVINTNIASLNAQRNLNNSQSLLNTSLQRLSSGLRINSAKDDAAGLAISERMTAQIRGLNQAVRNANDGISLAQTAEGALAEVTNNLQRIRELAIQSANATNSEDDRAALQKEVAQLKAEIDRVANQTSFNGTRLLDGSFADQAFQVGANQSQTITIAGVVNAQIASLGEWTSISTSASLTGVAATGAISGTPGTAIIDLSGVADATLAFTFDVNGTEVTIGADGARDAAGLAAAVVAAINTEVPGLATLNANGTDVDLSNTSASPVVIDNFSNGVASVTAAASGTPATPATMALGAFTDAIGGDVATVFTGTFTAGTDTLVVSSTGANMDAADLAAAFVAAGFVADGSGTVNGFTLNLGGETDIEDAITNGTLTVQRADGTNFTYAEEVTGTANTSDGGFLSAPAGPTTDGEVAVPGTPTFGALTGGNLTINGTNIEVAEASNAAERASALIAAINAQTTETGVTASLVNGNVQLRSADGDIEIGSDLNDPDDLAALTGLTVGTTAADDPNNIAGSTAYDAGSEQVGFAALDILTVDGANNAILAMDAALKSVNDARADLGAIQNRFSSVVANLQTTSENLSASRSRILDADFAAETASLTRAQILQQAGVAMLAQANALPNNVLSLLR